MRAVLVREFNGRRFVVCRALPDQAWDDGAIGRIVAEPTEG